MPRKYLIDKILPAHTIHLFGGPSGAGKTRMGFQWQADLSEGKPILGFSVPKALSQGYVCMDRSLASIEETYHDLGIDPQKLPNFQYKSCATQQMTLAGIPALFNPIPDLIWIDGIPTLLPSGDLNKYNEVASFLRLCLKLTEQYQTTFMGVLHATKTKENERYLNPRQRISGSVAWAAYSESVFLLEPVKPDNSNDRRRTLFVLPRNSAEFTKDFTFNDQGQLIELAFQEEQDKYELLLVQIPTSLAIDRNTILDLAQNLGIGKTKCDAFLAQCLEDGRLIKPEYGKYQRPKLN